MTEIQELLWRQYELHIKTYCQYLELTLKVNVFYYAVTGAILSYYFSHPEQPLAKYGLILPMVMSLALAAVFIVGAYLATYTRRDTYILANKLGLDVAPEMGILIILLGIFALLMLLVAVGLIYLVFLKC